MLLVAPVTLIVVDICFMFNLLTKLYERHNPLGTHPFPRFSCQQTLACDWEKYDIISEKYCVPWASWLYPWPNDILLICNRKLGEGELLIYLAAWSSSVSTKKCFWLNSEGTGSVCWCTFAYVSVCFIFRNLRGHIGAFQGHLGIF